ncbi:MAG: hypothetical protein QXS20_02400 [Candidatus Thorarchaeota archaeon]
MRLPKGSSYCFACFVMLVMMTAMCPLNTFVPTMASAGQVGRLPMTAIVRASYTPHDPVYVTSDMDFVVQGWPGNGTESDPFVIEGLDIATSGTTCITVQNTTAYFEIRGCVTSSASEHSIWLRNISHVLNALVVMSFVAAGAVVAYALLEYAPHLVRKRSGRPVEDLLRDRLQ